MKPPVTRDNELTGVLNRDKFDLVPAGVTTSEGIYRWEEFRRAYHRAQRLETLSDFPLQLDFELNSTCQLKCGFCVHGNEIVKKRTLGFELFKKAIDEGERYGLCSIKLNYINEPLLVRDLPDYVRYARAHGVLNVYFATNGILLTREVSRSLIESGVSKIMVSLDATTAETFSAMRSSDKFDEIVENIHGLIALREELGVGHPLVRVNFLKTELNIHEAEDFVAAWEGVADMIGLQDQVGIPGVDGEVLSESSLLQDRGSFRCSFPSKLMVVDSGGELLPCCTFNGREMPVGNLRAMTVKEAWDSTKMLRLRLLQREGRYMENPICRHCIHGGGTGG